MHTIVDVEQGSAEWFKARMGRATASEFSTVLAKGKGGGESLTRKKYLYQLAGEIISGEPAVSYENADMARGKKLEPEARAAYAFLKDAEPKLVGFVVNEVAGASPDSFLGDNGALEIKTKAAHLMVECIDKGEFPPEHKAQCQGVLWVAEREWIDFVAYWPGFPLFVRRAHRDEIYIAALARAVGEFNAELAEIVAKIRSYGDVA